MWCHFHIWRHVYCIIWDFLLHCNNWKGSPVIGCRNGTCNQTQVSWKKKNCGFPAKFPQAWIESQLLPGNRKHSVHKQQLLFPWPKTKCPSVISHLCHKSFLSRSMSSNTLSVVLEKLIRRLCLDNFPCRDNSWVSYQLVAFFLCHLKLNGNNIQ